MHVPAIVDIERFDHVAIATWDVSSNVHLLQDLLGATFHDGGDDRRAGYRWLQFTFTGGTVELLEPLHSEGFLFRFLQRKGEGLHHVTFKVRDLEGSIPLLTAAGYAPVDVNLAHESWKEAFLHPRDTGGVLVQLAQAGASAAPRPRPLADYLKDRPRLRPGG